MILIQAILGLFGYIKQAELDGIGLTNAEINGFTKLGILAGYAYTKNIITNCFSTGKVKGLSEIGGWSCRIKKESCKNKKSSVILNQLARITSWSECLPDKEEVGGSNPSTRTDDKHLKALVSRLGLFCIN